VVHRIDLPGIDRPNGILIGPGDRFLYICDNNNNTAGGARRLLRFELRPDGEVDPASRRVLFDWQPGRGPDGMKMDRAGRLYVAAGLNRADALRDDGFQNRLLHSLPDGTPAGVRSHAARHRDELRPRRCGGTHPVHYLGRPPLERGTEGKIKI